MQMNEKDFYLAVIHTDGIPLIYSSDAYKLEELDILNLIKILIIDRRGLSLGKKILEIYRDSTEHRKELTNERLNAIGIKENGDKNPTKAKKCNLR